MWSVELGLGKPRCHDGLRRQPIQHSALFTQHLAHHLALKIAHSMNFEMLISNRKASNPAKM